MKRTIQEVYELIRDKANNASLELNKMGFYTLKRSSILTGQLGAYNDVLSLIESSYLLDDTKENKNENNRCNEDI